MMKRRSDWPERMNEEIDAAQSRDFEYGVHDCCMFPANVIKAMTDVDLAKKWRGKYKTLRGSKSVLKTRGKGTLCKTVISIMKEAGCKQVPVAMARRGDPVMAVVRTPEGENYVGGICIGASAVFAADGLIAVPMTEVRRAWHCG